MRKLFKKSLACVLAVALCLTAMVGALTVSATETIAGTITAADAVIESNATSVTIPVTFAVAEGNELSEGFIDVSVTEGASISDIALPEGATGYDVDVNTANSRFELFTEGASGVASAIVNIVVAIDDITKAPFTLTLTDYTSATASEVIVVFGSKDVAITVKACEHANKITSEEVTLAATCTTDGSKIVTTTCGDCEEVISTETVVLPATGHDWVDGDITYSDCTSNGVMAQSCSKCEATQTVAVDPKGHTGVAYEEVAATCTTVGYTGGTYCSECEAVITERTEIPATGHTILYSDGDDEDHHTKYCSACDYSEQEAHTYVDGTCVCGATEVKDAYEEPALSSTFRSKGAMISNTFGINFQVRITNTTLEQYDADSFEVRITKPEFDTSDFTYKADSQVIVFKPEDTVGSETFTNYGIYIFEQGFALYEVQVPLTYSVHLFKGEQEVCHYTYLTTTLTEIANARYEEASSGSDSDNNVRKMIVALLNVATNVKTVFAAKDNTSENSPLKSGDAPNKDVDTETYAVSYDDLTANDVVKGSKTRDLSVAIEAAPSVFYEFRDSSLTNTPDAFYVEVSYFSKYKNETLKFTLDGTELTNRGYGIYNFKFTETYLFDSDKDITITVYNKDGNTVIDTAVCTINGLLLSKLEAEGISGDAYRAVASLAVHCRTFYPNY